ncbi:hypothetical protein ACQEV4_25445 [Streptomyces shenzhenensis]
MRDALAKQAKLSEDRLALLDGILPVLAEVGTLVREKIGADA